MPFYLGIDVGSGWTKAVLCEDMDLKSYAISPSGGDYRKAAQHVVDMALKKHGVSIDDIAYTVATGYGASMVDFASEKPSDMSCHAKGINMLFPGVRTVIDVGAQFTRAIRIDENGRIVNFIMNEKCAGGSGKFLQVTARILHVNIEELGRLSLESTKPVEFTTACAVFAESEAVSRISEGALPADIVAGIHKAMASKIITLANRVGLMPDYAITGGGAKDIGLVKAIEKELKASSYVAHEPQITAALGAALFRHRI
ncbi:MAG TPA: acyl-CoA dehydratase activase [Syntrophorhabdaceae bacterium]|nr:acyl-CoA dehydratase activase [Syntrophorhabdaceae bacterium]